jgi:hypothetical protein
VLVGVHELPFGKNEVGDRVVDVHFIHREGFAPPIAAPPRTQACTSSPAYGPEFVAGDISEEVFKYLRSRSTRT